jgi:hypothetical protein
MAMNGEFVKLAKSICKADEDWTPVHTSELIWSKFRAMGFNPKEVAAAGKAWGEFQIDAKLSSLYMQAGHRQAYADEGICKPPVKPDAKKAALVGKYS